MLLALQQEIYSFVALFILKYIGKHIEKYHKNTLYSTITTHKKRFFNVLEHAKRAAGHSRQAVRISILHNYALLIAVSTTCLLLSKICLYSTVYACCATAGTKKYTCISIYYKNMVHRRHCIRQGRMYSL